MSTTDAARLRARGHPIVLRDGTEAQLVYDFDSLETLEEEFGSLGALQHLIETDENGIPQGKAFGPLRKFIGAGLLHLGFTLDETKRLLDPARLSEYFGAASAALEEALPRAEGKAQAGQNGSRNGSTGLSSTTSPLSVSVVPTPSSGE